MNAEKAGYKTVAATIPRRAAMRRAIENSTNAAVVVEVRVQGPRPPSIVSETVQVTAMNTQVATARTVMPVSPQARAQAVVPPPKMTVTAPAERNPHCFQ